MSRSAGLATPCDDGSPHWRPEVDRHRFLDAMARLPSPVTVVTAWSEAGRPLGTTVSAVTSLSLKPPMIAIALDARSSLLRAIRSSGRFGVNVLSVQQTRVAEAFASKTVDRFASVAWQDSAGLPRLEGIVGWVAASLDASLRGGDHRIVMGRVEDAAGLDGAPLVYAGRRYASHTPLELDRDPASVDDSGTEGDEQASSTLLRLKDE